MINDICVWYWKHLKPKIDDRERGHNDTVVDDVKCFETDYHVVKTEFLFQTDSKKRLTETGVSFRLHRPCNNQKLPRGAIFDASSSFAEKSRPTHMKTSKSICWLCRLSQSVSPADLLITGTPVLILRRDLLWGVSHGQITNDGVGRRANTFRFLY